jgi:hypothetical protein
MKELFKSVDSVLVIDWPAKEVPELLALAGLRVVVHGGPGPEDYSAYEVQDGKVVVRRTGRPPKRADLIYSYRPLSELPEIVAAGQGTSSEDDMGPIGFIRCGSGESEGMLGP